MGVFYTTRGKQGDESDSVTQPLLQHKHQDSHDENHKADTHTATDGADPQTAVPQELELAGRDERGCSGSVRSLCSDSSRQHECPICSDPYDPLGDHRMALLNCNHMLCHRCLVCILGRAKDPTRVQCPFCRQNTPFPQWEIRRLQEESYNHRGPAFRLVRLPGPDPQASDPPPGLDPQVVDPTEPVPTSCCTALLQRVARVYRRYSPRPGLMLLLFLISMAWFLYMIVRRCLRQARRYH